MNYLEEIIKTRYFQIGVLVLVILDASIVIAEISISAVTPDSPVLDITKWISFSILSLFVLENIVKFLVIGIGHFNTFLPIFDLVIVIVSFILSITLRTGIVREIVGLLIIFRLWRIAKVVDSVLDAAHDKHQIQVEELQEKIRVLEGKLAASEVSLQSQQA